MPAQDRTAAGARGQVWYPVQDDNSTASEGSAETLAANSIAGCRAVASHSSDRGGPVFRAGWQNHARDSRDQEDWGSGWRARAFATASGPKCFDGDCTPDCGISRSKLDCAESEPTARECGD